jgi:hypothetical protein
VGKVKIVLAQGALLAGLAGFATRKAGSAGHGLSLNGFAAEIGARGVL